MSRCKYCTQLPEIGRVALALLSIPVMSIALVVCYLLLRSGAADEPLVLVAAHEAAAAPQAQPQAAAPSDAAVGAHEALDPVGAGREAAR